MATENMTSRGTKEDRVKMKMQLTARPQETIQSCMSKYETLKAMENAF